MKQANVPIEKAHEPEEGALQPSSQNMPPVRNKEKKRSFHFADDDMPDSQHSSSYKDVLSQPAKTLSHRQKLLWLQKRRIQGLWAQCDDCNRWRYLPTVMDRHDLPKKWYCKMNLDSTLASCSAPEIPIRIHEEEDLIYSEYTAGSLVLGRLPGWPWWPAMVDDCPDTEQYYWLDGLSDIPTHYHVVFFDASEVSRAWLATSQLKPYPVDKKILSTSQVNSGYQRRFEAAVAQANDAVNLTQPERLSKYSFIARYKGAIHSPKKISDKKVKKYQEDFKRKFSVDLPIHMTDTDSEIDENHTDVPKKPNFFIVGSKKPKADKDKDITNNSNTYNCSLAVEVGTNSVEAALSNDTSTSAASGTTYHTVVKSHKTSELPPSPGSNNFDF